MSKHAPGPWVTSGQTVKSVHHQRHYAVARVHNPLFTPEANAANARLIAAAPDLLAALCCIETDKDGDGFICAEAMEQVRAAIAKATGEQS